MGSVSVVWCHFTVFFCSAFSYLYLCYAFVFSLQANHILFRCDIISVDYCSCSNHSRDHHHHRWSLCHLSFCLPRGVTFSLVSYLSILASLFIPAFPFRWEHRSYDIVRLLPIRLACSYNGVRASDFQQRNTRVHLWNFDVRTSSRQKLKHVSFYSSARHKSVRDTRVITY